MIIELRRKRISGATCDGALLIDGERVCDTAENALHRVAPGIYQLEIRQDKQVNRKLLTLVPESGVGWGHFPTIRPGNGIHTLARGEILVGDRLLPGVVIHSHDTYERLHGRVYQALKRGGTCRLVVRG